jgi:hypothetical protein
MNVMRLVELTKDEKGRKRLEGKRVEKLKRSKFEMV